MDKELPFDEEINFKISDILDPTSLNNIKNDPKYCFQKFKIYFSKFFSLEEYFFKMEEKKSEDEVEIKKENETKKGNKVNNEEKKEADKKDVKIKEENKEIANKKLKNEIEEDKGDDKNENKESNAKAGKLSSKNETETDKKAENGKENEKNKEENKEYIKEKLGKTEDKKDKKNEVNDKSKVKKESKNKKDFYKTSAIFEKPNGLLISPKREKSKKSLLGKDFYSKNKRNRNKGTKNKSLIEFELFKKLNSQNIKKSIYFKKSHSLNYNNRKYKNELSLNYSKSNKKESLNPSGSENNYIIMNSKNESTFSLKSSGTIKSSSLSYIEKQALIAMGNNDAKPKKKEEKFPDYKLKLIKSNLNLDENDEMSGKAYEDYARKIFKIMCIIGTKKDVFFENPDKIMYERIIDFYLQNFFRYSFDINTPIKEVLYNNIQGGNELDIVYHLEYRELINIANKFQNYFLINNIKKDEKIIDIQDTDEISFICEIAKNIVKQGKEKLSQILNYIKIIAIMNTIAKTSIVSTEEYKELCYEYRCSPKTEKIFCIITDGEYKKLKKILDFITKKLLQSLSPTQSEIRKEIMNFIDSEKDLFYNETNPQSTQEHIYCTYLILANLKKK